MLLLLSCDIVVFETIYEVELFETEMAQINLKKWQEIKGAPIYIYIFHHHAYDSMCSCVLKRLL